MSWFGVNPGALGALGDYCKQERRRQSFCNTVKVEAYGVDSVRRENGN
jgi:hypothetical protein